MDEAQRAVIKATMPVIADHLKLIAVSVGRFVLTDVKAFLSAYHAAGGKLDYPDIIAPLDDPEDDDEWDAPADRELAPASCPPPYEESSCKDFNLIPGHAPFRFPDHKSVYEFDLNGRRYRWSEAEDQWLEIPCV